MDSKEQVSYTFRTFRIDVSERRLLENRATIPLTPKSFDLLVYLVERSGHLVEKDELLEKVWPDSIVEESNLARIVHTLRKVLGEDKNGERLIETVPKKGYRFVAEVTRLGDVDRRTEFATFPAEPEPIPPPARTLYSRSTLITVSAAIVGLVLVLALAAWSYRLSNTPEAASSEASTHPETKNGEAYQQYSQGRFLVERRHKGDYEKALEHFERAIELDPTYANALAGKADTKVVLFWGSSSHADISQARTAVRRAIEIDSRNSYARTVHCRILTTYDWDHSAAEKECRKAVELNPQDHEAQKELAFLLSSLGKSEEALQAMDRAIAIAPTSFNKRSRGVVLYHSRRYDEALEQFHQVGHTDPNYREAIRWLIRCHQMEKDYERALASYQILLEDSGATAAERDSVVTDFKSKGWNAVLEHMAGSPSLRTLFLAGTYAQLGQTDRAFEVLEDMYARKAILLITAAREPTLDPIRNDPRFADLLNRIGMKQN
ncbi:MAG: tetratricopeptide repeat protein [bacterium]|nr:tetratricopeptide repeat protein [bacterium]